MPWSENEKALGAVAAANEGMDAEVVIQRANDNATCSFSQDDLETAKILAGRALHARRRALKAAEARAALEAS
jgi:hypothetical protein